MKNGKMKKKWKNEKWSGMMQHRDMESMDDVSMKSISFSREL